MILECIYAQIKILKGALEDFSITTKNLGSKMQKSFFVEIKRFVCSFYWIEVQVVTNQSSRLEKHQTLDHLLMTDIL